MADAGPYEVLLRPAARNDLDGLGAKDRRRIIDILAGLGRQPRPAGIQKLRGYANEWRIRSGRYRILLSIDDRSMHVMIYRIVHRRDAYR